MKLFIKITTYIVFVIPFVIHAQTANLGIIKGIWFSQSEFFAGDTVRIYTGLQNNAGFDVEGTIEFFDNGKSLGTKTFSALDNRIIESWMDVVVTEGKHEFTVEITEARKNKAGEDITPVTPQTTFSESIAVVELDTDGDDIPDSRDSDDDNDGFSDDEELTAGTDPKDKNVIPQTPEPEEDISGDEISENSIQTIIQKIFTNNNEESKPSTNTETSISQNNTVIQDSPEIIQQLTEQNNLLKNILLGLGSAQNTTLDIVESQQKSTGEKIATKKQKNNNQNIKDSIQQKDTEQQSDQKQNSSGSGLGYWLLFMYRGLLGFFGWLFSWWWFWLLLPFAIVYVLMKIIFRIFRENR